MANNAEVEKSGNESNANLLRRFTRKVQGSGVLRRVRAIRYKTRNESHYKRKQSALKLLTRRAEVHKLIKLGKMQEREIR